MIAGQETLVLALLPHYLCDLRFSEPQFLHLENDKFGLDSKPSWKSLQALKFHDSIFCSLWLFSLKAIKSLFFTASPRLGTRDSLSLGISREPDDKLIATKCIPT